MRSRRVYLFGNSQKKKFKSLTVLVKCEDGLDDGNILIKSRVSRKNDVDKDPSLTNGESSAEN